MRGFSGDPPPPPMENQILNIRSKKYKKGASDPPLPAANVTIRNTPPPHSPGKNSGSAHEV